MYDKAKAEWEENEKERWAEVEQLKKKHEDDVKKWEEAKKVAKETGVRFMEKRPTIHGKLPKVVPKPLLKSFLEAVEPDEEEEGEWFQFGDDADSDNQSDQSN